MATTTAGQSAGNYTFLRQKFCTPLNATGLSGTLEVANDDYGDQYINQVGFGTKIGAGEITSTDIAAGLQAGGNLYAVRLLNNTHGGHASYSNTDHPGLAFRLTAAWSGLAPFAAGPATGLEGASLAITADPALLGGAGTFEYSIDYGDGTAATATGRSPQRASAMATTTASAQPGWARSTSSMRPSDTFTLPETITSSRRPSTRSAPSASSPASAVRNQRMPPSVTKRAAVSSGSPR